MWLAASALVSLLAAPVGAQAVSAIGDEALTLPGGVFRLSVSEVEERYSDRYGPNGPQPLGADLAVDSLGVGQLPILAPLQSALRTLTQNPALGITLGSPQVSSTVRVSVTPIGVELGVTHWLTLRGTIPIVRTRNDVFFNPNPGGRTGNVGLNPALVVPGALVADTSLFGQFTQAGASLQAAITACRANPGFAAYCPSLNAQGAAASALVAQAAAFASALQQVYGGGGRPTGVVVPVDQSTPWNTIGRRLRSFAASYAHFDSLTGGPGITGGPPVGAPALGLGDAQTLLTSNLLGLGLDSLQTVQSVHLGDVEVGATVLFLDSFHGNDSARIHPSGFNYRLAGSGVFRLGTGQPASPDNLVGVATGTGASAVEASAATDLLWGRHLWASVLARGTFPLSDQVPLRIPLGVGDEFPPAFTRQEVGRTLGRTIELEVDPRYAINNYFGLFTQYHYIRKDADRYSGVFSLDSAATGVGAVSLDASTLNTGTATTEHRIGVGATFSTVAGASRHGSRIPFEITYVHYETVAGSGGLYGLLPKQSTDQIQLRIYTRIFGSGAAFAPRR